MTSLLHQENKLSTFERDMKAFMRALEETVLPKPKLLEVGRNYSSSHVPPKAKAPSKDAIHSMVRRVNRTEFSFIGSSWR